MFATQSKNNLDSSLLKLLDSVELSFFFGMVRSLAYKNKALKITDF